jgi:hypothetical protein
MPIWLHLILTGICAVVCFFGGATLGAATAGCCIWALHAAGLQGEAVNVLVGVPVFFGGAALGLRLGTAFAVRCLPARCPQCGGRTFYRPSRPITYHCRSCQHVHQTRVGQR